MMSMDKNEKPPQRVDEPVAPATSDGTVPYTDPLPTAEADAAAPDGAPRPTKPTRRIDET